jgi:Rhodanese-related sulfurtransferase
MKYTKPLFALILIAIAVLSGCSEVSETKIEYQKITAQQAYEMMFDDVIVLDVRTEEEFAEGHIKNAVLLPDYEVKEKAESMFADKSQTILIYCRTGRRSALAAKDLIEMKYTKVYDFGGIVDWPYEKE